MNSIATWIIFISLNLVLASCEFFVERWKQARLEKRLNRTH
jgi:HAMP domain-containing protein